MSLLVLLAGFGIAAIYALAGHERSKPDDEYRYLAAPTAYHPFPKDMIIR